MPGAVFADPQLTSVATARGDHVVTGVQRIEAGRGSRLRRPTRPLLLERAAGTNESVIDGGAAAGPEDGE
jgi:hypothetical protein